MSGYVLLSWLAVQNDPFECERQPRRGEPRQRRLVDGVPVPGPTLTLLTDPTSPYRGQITDAVFFRQGDKEAQFHQGVYDELAVELRERVPGLRLHSRVFDGDDPTDHGALFEFLRAEIPRLRREFAGRKLIVHVSPGTPSMQTVWVLMAETGFIAPPFETVKSYRVEERRGRPAVALVRLGIDTYYKRYTEVRPRQVATEEQELRWDPTRFRSPVLQRLFTEAQRTARLRVPVLILGERGTGKTTLAGWIRAVSLFRKQELDRGWPAVACGQYTAEMMRAELFGYKKGAFTGALRDQDGLLKHADGDTVFLDEIGDVSRDMQRLLLKAIEEGRFQPLGTSEYETSRFRLLTATNLSWQELQGRLDADFLDRISAFVLRVPALREIRDDLDWLWDDVLATAARRAEVPAHYARLGAKPREQVLRALREHPLPANLRNLFQVAWRLLAARFDHEQPLPVDEAVAYALLALAPDDTAAMVTDAGLPRQVARAFVEGRPLPDDLLAAGRFNTEEVLAGLRVYLADELRRLARLGGVDLDQVADVGGRTLRDWARKKSSD